ncbi:MAG: hypothetical protein LPK07_15890 [Hymenobacteraceae bacterium]|nr:hypothetical protein [Hymenobacteraceae bacterium]MDX5483161.1 hypothetical protein [Hymenobacteraceae bacterium]
MATEETAATTETSQAGTAMGNGARLETRSDQTLGTYLTDAEGRSLYMFKADSAMVSNCYDACAEAWPPYLTEGTPTAGEGVNSAMLNTIQRRTGETQVTYNGWPLYYYVKDQGPGQTTGQDVMGFGAEWYLLSPEGNIVEGEDH